MYQNLRFIAHLMFFKNGYVINAQSNKAGGVVSAILQKVWMAIFYKVQK